MTSISFLTLIICPYVLFLISLATYLSNSLNFSMNQYLTFVQFSLLFVSFPLYCFLTLPLASLVAHW